MRCLILALSLVSLACQPKEYTCAQSRECVASGGNFGRCVDEHCAYQDPACPSGYRFDDTAGDDADRCVPATSLEPDAGVSDAGGPDGDLPSVDAAAPDAAGAVDAAAQDVASPSDGGASDGATTD
jgi:hypothetical protein